MIIDYTDCSTATGDFTTIPQDKVHASFKASNQSQVSRPLWRKTTGDVDPVYGVTQNNANICTLQFTLPNDIGPPVYLYYRLTNFYQNHRRYVKSLQLDQLRGDNVANESISGSACNPLELDKITGKAYYPCGLIANSIFNDTINSPSLVSSSGGQNSQNYSMLNTGIAWASDLQLYGKTNYSADQVSPPPNWQARYPDGYTNDNPIPDLSKYEEFAVWMRTAGLPTFSKLARRNDDDVMPAGTYSIQIYDCM